MPSTLLETALCVVALCCLLGSWLVVVTFLVWVWRAVGDIHETLLRLREEVGAWRAEHAAVQAREDQ